MSRIAEQQGFTCHVFFDEAKLVVASWATGAEPGGGARLAGYWVVFDQPVELIDVVPFVRRAWWMSGTATFASDESSECEAAVEELFGCDYHGEVASVRMILATHVGRQDDVNGSVAVVGSVWKQGQRQLTDSGRSVLPFDTGDAAIAEALQMAMAASTTGGAVNG